MGKPVRKTLTERQRHISIGTILGDACLEFDGYRGTRLQIKQSREKKRYVFWLFEEFKNLCKSSPKQKKDTSQWYFSTQHLEDFTKLREKFYSEKRKVVPEDIKQYLVSPLAIATWYMDDGALDYRSKGSHYAYYLNTDCFSFKEAELLKEVLWSNFQVKATVQNNNYRDRNHPRLYIGSKSRDKFLKIIKPFIIEEVFAHKLPSL